MTRKLIEQMLEALVSLGPLGINKQVINACYAAREYLAAPLRELSKGEVIDIAKRCNILDDTELLDSNQWRQDTLRELQAFAEAVLAAARSKP